MNIRGRLCLLVGILAVGIIRFGDGSEDDNHLPPRRQNSKSHRLPPSRKGSATPRAPSPAFTPGSRGHPNAGYAPNPNLNRRHTSNTGTGTGRPRTPQILSSSVFDPTGSSSILLPRPSSSDRRPSYSQALAHPGADVAGRPPRLSKIFKTTRQPKLSTSPQGSRNREDSHDHLKDVNFVKAHLWISRSDGTNEIRKFRWIDVLQMSYTLRGQTHTREVATEHDESVVVILYDNLRKQFLVVKQLRLAVHLQNVRKASGIRAWSDITWLNYPLSNGETVEFCAGMVDKKKRLEEIVQDEIREECGYEVDVKDIRKIKTYLADYRMGANQYLFYAEVNDHMRIRKEDEHGNVERGGLHEEGEYIDNEFLTMGTAFQLTNGRMKLNSQACLLYGLAWFFLHHNDGREYIRTRAGKEPVVPQPPSKNASSALYDVRFARAKLISFHRPDQRSNSDLSDGRDRVRDLKKVDSVKIYYKRTDQKKPETISEYELAMEGVDSVAMLLYDKNNRRFVFRKQFEPSVFIHRVKRLAKNRAKNMDAHKSKEELKTNNFENYKFEVINWEEEPASLGDTVELCTGINGGVKQVVRDQCGYAVNTFTRITKYLNGVGLNGSYQDLYLAIVSDEVRINDWGTGQSDFSHVYMTLDEAKRLVDGDQPADSPSNLLYALSWFFLHHNDGREYIRTGGRNLQPQPPSSDAREYGRWH